MTTVTQKVAISGITPVGTAPTVYHTANTAPFVATSGTDTTPVVTETYLCAVRIDANTILTGISILNGSAVAGNITVALADSLGNIVAVSASTAASGTAAYQKVPFASTIFVRGPSTYFVVLQHNNTGNRYRSHNVGNTPAGKLTGQVYGTIVAFTVPTTFTADLGPIADTY